MRQLHPPALLTRMSSLPCCCCSQLAKALTDSGLAMSSWWYCSLLPCVPARVGRFVVNQGLRLLRLLVFVAGGECKGEHNEINRCA